MPKFCGECGASLAQPAPKFCPSCGKAVEKAADPYADGNTQPSEKELWYTWSRILTFLVLYLVFLFGSSGWRLARLSSSVDS